MAAATLLLSGCGGGKSSPNDSGSDKTYLSAAVSDPDADTLSYEWRATAGAIENRNSPQTVWTMPPGPGLHFAYLKVSDGKGGEVTYQYAVPTDKIDNEAPTPAAVVNTPAAVPGNDAYETNGGATQRLRLFLDANGASSSLVDIDPSFTGSSGSARRRVYMPDIRVKLVDTSDLSNVFFSGSTDIGGEVTTPPLIVGKTYNVSCTDAQGLAYAGCAPSIGVTLPTPPAQLEASATSYGLYRGTSNLQLYGHIALLDGSICGGSDEFFDAARTATVRLLLADGTPASQVVRVNRFGDYALDAAVSQQASLRVNVVCGSYSANVPVTAPAGGYIAGTVLEVSHVVPNRRPQILRMVANGPEGSVRGREVLPEANAFSDALPGGAQFLTYKGTDTRLSACMYYKSFGAVAGCDSQGRMANPISLDDWKRQHGLAPFNQGNEEVSATYINRRDLNLVRRMVATKRADDHIAFVVCNHPGPFTDNQREVDAVIDTALADEKRVACVAMEYTTTPGRSKVSGVEQPFTKFLTFGPGGNLIASVNLDGRGEKFMPGACVACHGGPKYLGRFPSVGEPSPDMRAGFLAFDTGNYAFSSRPALTEAAQALSIKRLNELVLATHPAPATQNLINGWYLGGTAELNKQYVPPAWNSYSSNAVTTAQSASFYRSVVGTSCRTCHAAMRDTYNWDAGTSSDGLSGPPRLLGYKNNPHICGNSVDPYVNGSMPNALASVDRLQSTLRTDAAMAALMTELLGCTQSAGDPIYPKR